MMFSRKKPAARPEEPFVGGWRPRDLRELAQRLSKEEPRLATTLIGVVHGGRLDGPRFRYDSEGGRRSERARLVRETTEVSGRLSWPSALVQGRFDLIHDREALEERGEIGKLSFTSRLGDNSSNYDQPLLEFSLGFLEPQSLVDMRQSLLATLSGGGQTWLNLFVKPIGDADEWVSYFCEKGYSQSVEIVGAYLGTAAGRNFDM